ncbi:heme-dependent peroxidase, partial [Staphylococcus pseudintermedius]
MDWASWRLVPQEGRADMLAEFHRLMDQLEQAQSEGQGDQVLYSVTGEKA